MTSADIQSTLDMMNHRLELLSQRVEALADLLQAQPRQRTVPEKIAAQSTLTADQLDALAIDAIGNVLFEVRVRDGRRVCEVARKALYDYLSGPMMLPKADAYAVNDHIASRPGVEEFKVRTAVWYRWPEDAELFPVMADAEVVELKPATPRRII